MRLLIAARNRAIAIEDGIIVEPEGAFDIVLQCPDADVRPGLINAHDHAGWMNEAPWVAADEGVDALVQFMREFERTRG